MKLIQRLLFASILSVFGIYAVLGQTDELRQATGLPIQIGQPVIFGKITIARLRNDDKKPVVHVSLLEAGVQLGRMQANDAGYYYFLTLPRNSGTLVFEINNIEIGRVNADVGGGRTIRQDFSIDWEEFQRRAAGIVSAKDLYPRSAENAKAFAAALQLVKEKHLDKALDQFNGILERDPKDYVAWTEVGTVYFKGNSLDNAEACYFKAIELKKDYEIALLNLGKLYLLRKQFDNAILVLSNAVKGEPDSAEAHYYLGESFLQAKKGNQAVFHLNEAIRLAPVEKADAHLRLASLYNAAGIKDKAIAEYKAFLQKVKEHPEREKIEKYIKDNSPE